MSGTSRDETASILPKEMLVPGLLQTLLIPRALQPGLPRLRLATLLIVLVLTVLLPTLSIGAAAAWEAIQGRQEAAEARLRDTARALSLAVESELGRYRSVAAALATSDALDGPEPDLARFEAQARRVAATLDSAVALIDPMSMRQVVNTALPPGQQAGLPAVADYRAMLETGRPMVIDLVTGPLMQRPVAGVVVPVLRDSRVRFILAVRLLPERLHDLLAAQGLPDTTYASIADARNATVAISNAAHAANVGRPINPGSARAIAGQAEGIYRAVGGDGTERVFAFRKLDAAPDWTLAVAQPAAELDGAWRKPMATLAAGGAVALAIGGVLTLLTARGILLPLRRLNRHARALAGGAEANPDAAAAIPPSSIIELETLRRGFAEAEAALFAREGELRALFRASPVGIVHAAIGGRVFAANDAFLAIVGGTREALEAGRIHWGELTPPDSSDGGEAAIAEVEAGPWGCCRPYEKEYVRPDGIRVPLLLSFALEDRATGQATCFVVDLSEVRRAEAAIRASEARFRGMAEAVSSLLFEADADGANTWTSEAWLAYTGFTAAQAAGNGWAAAIHPDDLTVSYPLWRQAIEAGTPFENRWRIRHHHGAWRHHLVRAVPARDAAGQIERWLGSVTDIEELVAIQAAVAEDQTRQAFLLRLGDALRPLAGADETVATACRLLGETLGVAQVGFAEAEPDGERVTVRRTWGDSRIPSVVGTWRIDDFGPDLGCALRGGEMFICADVATDPRLGAAGTATHAALGIGSFIDVPLMRGGRMAAVLFIGHPEPRDWSAAERELAEEVCARLWEAVERARAEAALRASEEHLRLATEGGGIGTWELDLWTGMGHWSPEAGALLGRDRLVDTAETWPEAIHPDDRDGVTAAWRRAVEEGAPYDAGFRAAAPAPDGGERWLVSRGWLERDAAGRPLRALGVLIDLTRQRRAEAALADSEARFRAITNAMPQMVWSTRPDGWHDYYNRRWYEMTGTTPEQVIGDGCNPVFHPDDRDRAWARWRHSLETGEPYEIEYRLRMSDGGYRWMLGRALPVRDAEGRIIRWYGTCTDIEEIVDARLVLASNRVELERLVEERTRDLEQTQTRLAHMQRMEALGQLAGGIAHDFNNVLQAVQGGAALIERRHTDPDGVRRLTRMVTEAANRGAAITRRLLAFSRRGDLRTEAVDPAALLTDLREVLTHTLGAGIGVRVTVPPGLPPLLADKSQLETVLINLATNARDAMAGNGTLSLAGAVEPLPRDNAPGYPDTLKPGTYLRLSVTDTGTGMTPDVLARVTEPFFTTKAQGTGTGLGLAMAKGFAEQSGGGLHIESAPGRGTTVMLWFPLATGIPVAARAPDRDDAMNETGHARLLVVDDEPLVREILTEELAAAGYAVLAAPDSPTALALLDAGEAVDLLVSDLSMPGMDGVSLIREAQRRQPRLPAILLTGFATNAAEIAVGDAVSGTFTLLRKPIEGRILAERVAVLLAGEIAGKRRRSRRS